MKYTKYLLLAVCSFYVQGAIAITLEEALPLAYKNSNELKVAQQTFLGEIEAMSRAISSFYPDINAGVQVSNTKARIPSGVVGDQNMDSTSQSLTATQAIFNGGSSVAALKSAQAQFRASRGKFYDSEQKFLLNAVDTYLSCYEAQAKYEIASTSVEFRRKELEAAEERFKLGEETRTGTSMARAQLAKAEADKAATFAQMQQYNALFHKLFNVDPVELVLPEEPLGMPDSSEILVNKSIASNHTMQQVRHTASAAKASAVGALGGLLPNVSLSASSSRTSYNPHGSQTISGTPAVKNKQFTTTLSVNIPIFSKGGAEYSNIRAANSEARRLAHQMNDALLTLKVQASSVWDQYQALKAGVIFNEEYVKAQTLTLEGMTQEYAVGSKSMIDVLDTEDKLNQARVGDVANKKNYINTAYQIKALMGEMTAKTLKLKVKYFEPEFEFKKIKAKVVGF